METEPLTNDQIAQIIQQYLSSVLTQQYIGARYVPLFINEHSTAEAYEPLTIYFDGTGSYISRQWVPGGVALTDTDYWLHIEYNAQMAQLQSTVNALSGRVDNVPNLVNDALSKSVVSTTPEAYGAKGDGVTDDTSAFTQAFATGLPVVLDPKKNYFFSGTVDAKEQSRVILIGNGAKLTNYAMTLNLSDDGTTWRKAHAAMPAIISQCYFMNGTDDRPIFKTGSPLDIGYCNFRNVPWAVGYLSGLYIDYLHVHDSNFYRCGTSDMDFGVIGGYDVASGGNTHLGQGDQQIVERCHCAEHISTQGTTLIKKHGRIVMAECLNSGFSLYRGTAVLNHCYYEYLTPRINAESYAIYRDCIFSRYASLDAALPNNWCLASRCLFRTTAHNPYFKGISEDVRGRIEGGICLQFPDNGARNPSITSADYYDHLDIEGMSGDDGTFTPTAFTPTEPSGLDAGKYTYYVYPSISAEGIEGFTFHNTGTINIQAGQGIYFNTIHVVNAFMHVYREHNGVISKAVIRRSAETQNAFNDNGTVLNCIPWTTVTALPSSNAATVLGRVGNVVTGAGSFETTIRGAIAANTSTHAVGYQQV